MSQRNDEMAGVVFVIAFIGFAIYLVVIAVAAMLALFALVFTILALFAWNRPLHMGRETLQPEEARAFIYRGIFAAVVAPVFTLFVWMFLDAPPFGWEIYALSAGAGYVVGSVGIEILIAAEEQHQAPQPNNTPRQLPSAPPPNLLPAPPKKPFRYASWDDEEQGR